MKKLLVSLSLVIVATLGLSACSAPAAATKPMTTGTVVVDVRTPGEYAQGHLEGAINADVESSTFESQVKELPTDATYLLYCHSGTRAAAAVSRMTAMGFAHLTNAGGIDQAAASTGLAIVTVP